MLDVIVIGAGPSGSHCAYLLGKCGHKVLVLERKHQAGTKRVCTGIIGKECLHLLNHASVDTAAQYNSATFFSPSHKILKVEKSTPQAYAVDRAVFDNQLVRVAREAGVEYSFDTPVDTLEADQRRVRVGIERGGQHTYLEAEAVVIASGFGSRLPEMVGLGEIPFFARGCQTEVAVSSSTGVEVYMGRAIAPGFFAWLVPTSQGQARMGLLAGSNSRFLINNLWKKLHSEGKVTSPLGEVRYGAVPMKALARTYATRTVVIGDVAGQVKPTTGGGIYYGLLCASMAANCLHEAIVKDDFSARQMRSYEKEWHDKLLRELRIDYTVRRIFQKLSDKQLDQIFDLFLSQGIHDTLLASEDFSFDWHSKLVLEALKYKVLQGPLSLLRTRLTSFLQHDQQPPATK